MKFFACSIARISGNPTGHWLWTSFGSFHSRRPGDRSSYFDFCSAALVTMLHSVFKDFKMISLRGESKHCKLCSYHFSSWLWALALRLFAAASRCCICLTITGVACCFDCVSSHLIQVLKNVKTLCRTRKHVDTRTIQDVYTIFGQGFQTSSAPWFDSP